jgi:hypothetical protein
MVFRRTWKTWAMVFNPVNAKFNPICHLLALLVAHPILHVSRLRVKGKGGYESRVCHL